MRNMLNIENLAAGYGDHSVISLIELNLSPGQTCLIRGPSGSGKTTLLHTIAGFLPPRSGTVCIEGVSIYSLTEGKRDNFRGRRIGIIFQTLHLMKSLSVKENLELASYACGRAHDLQQANDLLEKLGIIALQDKPAMKISQGQAQRVAIARALLGGPSLILADEPTSSLDDKACAETGRLLKDLCKETNAVLIISSHDARIGSDFDQIITLGESI